MINENNIKNDKTLNDFFNKAFAMIEDPLKKLLHQTSGGSGLTGCNAIREAFEGINHDEKIGTPGSDCDYQGCMDKMILYAGTKEWRESKEVAEFTERFNFLVALKKMAIKHMEQQSNRSNDVAPMEQNFSKLLEDTKKSGSISWWFMFQLKQCFKQTVQSTSQNENSTEQNQQNSQNVDPSSSKSSFGESLLLVQFFKAFFAYFKKIIAKPADSKNSQMFLNGNQSKDTKPQIEGQPELEAQVQSNSTVGNVSSNKSGNIQDNLELESIIDAKFKL